MPTEPNVFKCMRTQYFQAMCALCRVDRTILHLQGFSLVEELDLTGKYMLQSSDFNSTFIDCAKRFSAGEGAALCHRELHA